MLASGEYQDYGSDGSKACLEWLKTDQDELCGLERDKAQSGEHREFPSVRQVSSLAFSSK